MAETVLANTTTNLRPFLNKDYTNNVEYKHGAARPMKHYRLGKINSVSLDTNSLNTYIVSNNSRYVPSSKAIPLVSLTMDRPGCVNRSNNDTTDATCLNVDVNNLPSDNNCCEATKALKRVRGSSTVLNKEYYQTQKQYLQSRCKTIKQTSFHYANQGIHANCSTNSSAPCLTCNSIVYKPSNQQYTQDGGVSSSSRTTRLTLNTIKRNLNTTDFSHYKRPDYCSSLPNSLRPRCKKVSFQ